jgi:hypothetical protein
MIVVEGSTCAIGMPKPSRKARISALMAVKQRQECGAARVSVEAHPVQVGIYQGEPISLIPAQKKGWEKPAALSCLWAGVRFTSSGVPSVPST